MKLYQDGKRNIALDGLKVLAAFLVVMLHCTAFYMTGLEAGTMGYRFCRMLNSVGRMGVPIFVMVSGAIFLDPRKDCSLKKLWLHTILRLVIVYLIWDYVYDVKAINGAILQEHSLRHALEILLDAPYHFWFIPMIIGLYAVVPFLRTWLAHAQRREVQYFLGLYFIVQIVRETAAAMAGGSAIVQYLSDFTTIGAVCNYIGYYVLGIYLVQYEPAERSRKLLYLSAVPCVLAGYFESNPFIVFTFVSVTALFTAFVHAGESKSNLAGSDGAQEKGKTGFSGLLRGLIGNLGKDTLGIFLMHLLFLTLYNRIIMEQAEFAWEWKAVVMTVLCFASSAVVTELLRRIPVVGRYLV